jgi:hypothetical protein
MPQEKIGGKLNKEEVEEIIYRIEEDAKGWLKEPRKILQSLPENIIDKLPDNLKQQMMSEKWNTKDLIGKWDSFEERQRKILANILGVCLSQAFIILAEQQKGKEEAIMDENIIDVIEFICKCVDTVKGGFSYPALYIAGGKFPETLVPIGSCSVLEALVEAKELLARKKLPHRVGLGERIDDAAKKIVDLLISDELRVNNFYDHVYIPRGERLECYSSPDLWTTATVITVLSYYCKIYKDSNVKEKISETVKSIKQRSISALKEGLEEREKIFPSMYWRNVPKEVINKTGESSEGVLSLKLETESIRWRRVDENGHRTPIIPLVGVATIFLQGLDIFSQEEEKNEIISWLNMTLLRIIEKFEDLYRKSQQASNINEIWEELVERTPRFILSYLEEREKIGAQRIMVLPLIVKLLWELYKKGVIEENEIVRRSLFRFPEYYPVMGICLRALNVLFRARKAEGKDLFGYDVLSPADMGLSRLIYSLLKDYRSSFDDIERFFLREPGKFIERWRYDVRFEINIRDVSPDPLEVEKKLHASIKEKLDKLTLEEFERAIEDETWKRVEEERTDKFWIEGCICNFYDDRNGIKIPIELRPELSIRMASLTYSAGFHYIARGRYYREGRFQGKDLGEMKDFEKRFRGRESSNSVWRFLLEEEREVFKEINKNEGRVVGLLYLPKKALNIHWEAFPLGGKPLGIIIPVGRILEVKGEVVGGRERDFMLNILLIGDSGRRIEGLTELSVKSEIDSIKETIESVKEKLEGYSINIRSSVDEDERLSDILRECSWDVLHFAGHAITKGEKVMWVVGGSYWDPDDELRGIIAPRLVFANACGTAEVTNAQIMSQAEAFMRQGTSIFIGALAPIHDNDAVEFAKKFYKLLIEEKEPVGEALRGAREKLYNNGSPVWRFYVLYGDPRMKIIT